MVAFAKRDLHHWMKRSELCFVIILENNWSILMLWYRMPKRHMQNKSNSLHIRIASVSILKYVVTMFYGFRTRLTDIATITIPDSQIRWIQISDNDNLKSIEKSIIMANIDWNPVIMKLTSKDCSYTHYFHKYRNLNCCQAIHCKYNLVNSQK